MIYNLGLTLGLSVTDIDKMTAGEVIDLVYYRVNQLEKKTEKKAERKTENGRKATQADYDSF